MIAPHQYMKFLEKEKNYFDELSFTFLSKEQVISEDCLDILKKYGHICHFSDYAIMLGGETYSVYGNHHRVGRYWLKDNLKLEGIFDDTYSLYSVLCRHLKIDMPSNNRVGIRPVIVNYSIIKEIYKDLIEIIEEDEKTISLYFGEYPQSVVSPEKSRYLDLAFKKNKLKKTGKKYTICDSYFKKGRIKNYKKEFDEYEYNGQKYVFVTPFLSNTSSFMSNGMIPPYEGTWFLVSKIKWLVDKKTDLLLSEKVLFSGITLDNETDVTFKYYGNFENTSLKKYIDIYFKKEIVPSDIKKYKKEEVNDEKTDKVKVSNEKKDNKILNNEEKLINDIKEKLKNIDNLIYKEKISNKVNNLLDEYNHKISNLDSDKLLVIPKETLSGLKRILLSDLIDINDELDKILSYSSLYHEIIKELDDLLKIMKGEKIECNTSLKNDLNIISNYSLPFIENSKSEELRNKIISLLKEKRILIEEILNYIYFNKENIGIYKNKQEFEFSLRKELHPIFNEINNLVEKYDILKQIIEGTNLIIKKNYQKSKTNIINTYINIMNNLYQEIIMEYSLSEEESRKLEKIIKKEIDINKDVNEILNDLTSIIKEMYIFKFALEDKIKEKELLQKSIIKIRI